MHPSALSLDSFLGKAQFPWWTEAGARSKKKAWDGLVNIVQLQLKHGIG